MGLFQYIVRGPEEACRKFLLADEHCYYRDVDSKGGTPEAYEIWFSGSRRFMPSYNNLQIQSKSFGVEILGSYENEDREPDEEPGTYFHYLGEESRHFNAVMKRP